MSFQVLEPPLDFLSDEISWDSLIIGYVKKSLKSFIAEFGNNGGSSFSPNVYDGFTDVPFVMKKNRRLTKVLKQIGLVSPSGQEVKCGETFNTKSNHVWEKVRKIIRLLVQRKALYLNKEDFLFCDYCSSVVSEQDAKVNQAKKNITLLCWRCGKTLSKKKLIGLFLKTKYLEKQIMKIIATQIIWCNEDGKILDLSKKNAFFDWIIERSDWCITQPVSFELGSAHITNDLQEGEVELLPNFKLKIRRSAHNNNKKNNDDDCEELYFDLDISFMRTVIPFVSEESKMNTPKAVYFSIEGFNKLMLFFYPLVALYASVFEADFINSPNLINNLDLTLPSFVYLLNQTCFELSNVPKKSKDNEYDDVLNKNTFPLNSGSIDLRNGVSQDSFTVSSIGFRQRNGTLSENFVRNVQDNYFKPLIEFASLISKGKSVVDNNNCSTKCNCSVFDVWCLKSAMRLIQDLRNMNQNLSLKNFNQEKRNIFPSIVLPAFKNSLFSVMNFVSNVLVTYSTLFLVPLRNDLDILKNCSRTEHLNIQEESLESEFIPHDIVALLLFFFSSIFKPFAPNIGETLFNLLKPTVLILYPELYNTDVKFDDFSFYSTLATDKLIPIEDRIKKELCYTNTCCFENGIADVNFVKLENLVVNLITQANSSFEYRKKHGLLSFLCFKNVIVNGIDEKEYPENALNQIRRSYTKSLRSRSVTFTFSNTNELMLYNSDERKIIFEVDQTCQFFERSIWKEICIKKMKEAVDYLKSNVGLNGDIEFEFSFIPSSINQSCRTDYEEFELFLSSLIKKLEPNASFCKFGLSTNFACDREIEIFGIVTCLAILVPVFYFKDSNLLSLIKKKGIGVFYKDLIKNSLNNKNWYILRENFLENDKKQLLKLMIDGVEFELISNHHYYFLENEIYT